MWSNQQPPIPRVQSVAERLFWEHHTGTLGLQIAGTVPLNGHHPTPAQLKYMEDWGRQYYIRNRRELNQQGIFDAHLAPQLPNYQDPRPGQQEGVNRQMFEIPQHLFALGPLAFAQALEGELQQMGRLEPRNRQQFQSPFSIENLLKPDKRAAKETLPPHTPPQMFQPAPIPPTNSTHTPLWIPQMLTQTPPMLQPTTPVTPQIPLMTPQMLPQAPTLPTNFTHMPFWTAQMFPQTPPMLQQTAPVMDHRLMAPQMLPQLPQAPTGRGRGRAPRNTCGVARGGSRGRARGGARGRPRKETSTNQIQPPPPRQTIQITPEIQKALESLPSLPVLPLIASSEPEIVPESGGQLIEPAVMAVATPAVNALSPGDSGAPKEDQSASQSICAKKMGMPVEKQPVTKRPKVVEEGSPPEESCNVQQEIVTGVPHDAQQESERVVDAAGEAEQNGVGLGAEHSTAAVQDRQQLRRDGMRRLRALMEGRSEKFRRGIVALLNSAVAIFSGPSPPETAQEFIEEMDRRSQGASNNAD